MVCVDVTIRIEVQHVVEGMEHLNNYYVQATAHIVLAQQPKIISGFKITFLQQLIISSSNPLKFNTDLPRSGLFRSELR